MESQLPEEPEDSQTETPEDVAVLYSWANLHGAKYRDFSAARREVRAQVRHRVAEQLRLTALKEKAEAESNAITAERDAQEAGHAVHAAGEVYSQPERMRMLAEAVQATDRAAAERLELARRAELACLAEAESSKEERVIARAQAAAQKQAERYIESELRRRHLAGPQPIASLHAVEEDGRGAPPEAMRMTGTYDSAGPQDAAQLPHLLGENTLRSPFSEEGSPRVEVDRSSIDEDTHFEENPNNWPLTRTDFGRVASRPTNPGPYIEPLRRVLIPVSVDRRGHIDTVIASHDPLRHPPVARTIEPGITDIGRKQHAVANDSPLKPEQHVPAWFYTKHAVPQAIPPSVTETLQQSREQVAARWYALKSVFGSASELDSEMAADPAKESRIPLLAVFALAGGVGRTSLVATLGRTLSSMGEKVLLADTNSYGLLPFYFSASELRPGVVRTFSPPSGSSDAPIHLVSYDVEQRGSDAIAEKRLATEISQSASGMHRILLDLNASSGFLMRRFPSVDQIVLVPLAPDMNSVLSLRAIESFFEDLVGEDGRPVQPVFLINQFDAALPLHLDVREVLRQKLGDRLLPFVIRRSPAVSEALAEGMTVVDYARETPIAEDYRTVASWLRNTAAAASHSFRSLRWSEQ